jgi:UDP-GlcNAc:undecaprenyl-phosphate GlcNAc-1-phosphate transferase
MTSTLFFSFVGSLMLCMALIPLLRTAAWRWAFVDLPRDRHQHRQPVPKIGGIAFAVATLVAVLLWAPKERMILASLAGGLIIMLFGLWDDRVGLGPMMKFAGQAIAALFVILYADVRIMPVPFAGDLAMSWWLSIPVTFLVIVGMTNAVNLADGLDGLAGGITLLSFAGIGYLAFEAEDPALLILMVAVLGSLMGFLRFNTYPAQIFMGDAGSQFLGHYLAVAAILLLGKGTTPYSPMIALFLWGIPLLDTVGVIVQRLHEGRSPFVGDRNHLHHKLLVLGCSHRCAVIVIYSLQGVAIGCAYLLRWQTDLAVVLAYLAYAALVLGLFALSGRWSGRVPAERPQVTRSAVSHWPVRVLEWAVPLYLVGLAAMPLEVPREVGPLAWALAIVVVGGLIVEKGRDLAIRVGLYTGGTALVYYADLSVENSLRGLWSPVNLATALMVFLVIAAVRRVEPDRFELTPLDYLILLVACLLPFVSNVMGLAGSAGLLAAKAIVLFLAVEIVLSGSRPSVLRLGWWTAGVLGAVAIRSWGV